MQRFLWFVLALLMMLTTMTVGQTAPAHGAPTPHLGRQPGLVESVKQGSSSRGPDYGERFEQVRNVIVDTIKACEFWISIVSLGLNVGLFFYVLYLDAVRRQVIRSTARLVATYQSQLAKGHRSFLELQQDYSQFKDAFELEKEPRISAKAPAERRRGADDARDLRAASGQAAASPLPSDETVVSMRRQITTLTRQLESERQKNRGVQGE